ncbi:MAG: DUF5615 family PIN-like protein [Chloroflexota bacterium]|nr:DUF5615 family PIN-like protein [Chloroflexota bacterium]
MNVAMRLRDMGHDVVTVDDIGLKGAHDEEHLFFARNQGRVFVSHDGDFYLIHRSLQRWGVAVMHGGILITPDTLGVVQDARALDIFASSELPIANALYYWDERVSWVRYQ